jgi:hypothetical protein
MLRAPVLILSLAFASACAEPPNREMHQAQGAIDAARAAGAEQYAGEELKGAIDALAQANVAVTANDYRLALSLALDSRERAQNAAKAAVEARAKARGDAERRLAETTALVERTEARLKAPDIARLPRRVVAPVQTSVTTARTTLQETRAALEREEYDRVGKATGELTTQIQAALKSLDEAAGPPARPRKR